MQIQTKSCLLGHLNKIYQDYLREILVIFLSRVRPNSRMCRWHTENLEKTELTQEHPVPWHSIVDQALAWAARSGPSSRDRDACQSCAGHSAFPLPAREQPRLNQFVSVCSNPRPPLRRGRGFFVSNPYKHRNPAVDLPTRDYG